MTLRDQIIDALLDPPGGEGLADFSPDRASEETLADAVLNVLKDPVNREEKLKLILGPDYWENFVFAMGEQGWLPEVLGWKEPVESFEPDDVDEL